MYTVAKHCLSPTNVTYTTEWLELSMKMNAIPAYTLKPLAIMLAYAGLIPYAGTMLLVTSHIQNNSQECCLIHTLCCRYSIAWNIRLCMCK